jgi:hypothetical protein
MSTALAERSTSQPVATPATKSNTGPMFVLLGGGGLVVGAIMPWVTATAPFVGSVSFAGTKGDGVLTLMGGALIALLGLVMFGNPSRGGAVVVLLVAIAGGGVCLYDMSNVSNAIAEAENLDVGVTAEVGSGLYVSVVAAIVAVIGALTVLNHTPARRNPPPNGAGFVAPDAESSISS